MTDRGSHVGLDLPTTDLKAARLALGWKQSRVLAELAEQAKRDGIAIAAPASLKTMLSRWENGNGRPDATYQRLFCRIYDREPEELGFACSAKRPTGRVAPVVSRDTVEYFEAVFQQHVRADQLMGPRHLVDVVRAQAELLDRILPDTRPGPIRDDLLRLSCRFNEFAGWLYQDAGDGDNAMMFSVRAMDRALALEDPVDSVYLLMRKSNITCDRGQPDRAVMLADAAERALGKVPPRVRAVVLAQRARAHALRGAVNDCARSLDDAAREAMKPDNDADPIAAYCTPEYVAMEAAACWLALGQPAKAVPIFERALASWPPAQRRDLGLCQARLALAYARVGSAAQAAEAGLRAGATLRTAASARAIRELNRTGELLLRWRREARVAEFVATVRGLSYAV